MFRNPRENRSHPGDAVKPSVGRPPSPQRSTLDQGTTSFTPTQGPPIRTSTMSSRTSSVTKKPTQSQISMAPSKTPTRKPSTTAKTNGSAKTKPQGNASILSFFQKADKAPPPEKGLFMEERSNGKSKYFGQGVSEQLAAWGESMDVEEEETRFNESNGSVKRRRTEDPTDELFEEPLVVQEPAVEPVPEGACSPPPPDVAEQAVQVSDKPKRQLGPFVEDSDSEDEVDRTPRLTPKVPTPVSEPTAEANTVLPAVDKLNEVSATEEAPKDALPRADVEETSDLAAPEPLPEEVTERPVIIKREDTTNDAGGGFEDFEGMEDFDDEFPEGEEFMERKWMEEQRLLELAEAGLDDDMDEIVNGAPDVNIEDGAENGTTGSAVAACPICNASLNGITDQEAAVHVNNCLDGNPTPIPERKTPIKLEPPTEGQPASLGARRFQRPPRPPKPGQENPFTLGENKGPSGSAFSKLMSGHAEDMAWATAAAEEHRARGKPAYQRTCPFYKILPGFSICVDAFRYGAVAGCQAYYLSHFHSDHYIGLTSSWCHGPIYCSRVTANLVRQQLRVDPKWVVDLEFEKKIEVPGTGGVEVTMIPANHCPGSSLYLFEKVVGTGRNPRKQRVLHCGDFRACKAHIEHPLLRPDVVDIVTGKQGQQKLDVCYLDTTYLNPKYAFPPQEEVIQACADMCVSLSKFRVDETDGWEQMKRERAGSGMVKFVRKQSDLVKEEPDDDVNAMAVTKAGGKQRGRLLVVVGTYSIGKERICLGIARALGSKIYAPPGKQRICAALEDPELSALLTNDPREAQVHMTPLFEIRAETLDDYLKDYKDDFTRAVGFRPSGWNYRPPNSRFVESPAVQTVLHSDNWRSAYSMKDLVPQRGSTSRASCFGVPYSEHSSFRELTMFCCALRIDKVIPTVNVGSAKSREKMKGWCEKWAMEKKKNGLFRLDQGKGW